MVSLTAVTPLQRERLGLPLNFHTENENVWPDPLFAHIKMDISELSGGEVWVFQNVFLAESTISPIGFLATSRAPQTLQAPHPSPPPHPQSCG